MGIGYVGGRKGGGSLKINGAVEQEVVYGRSITKGDAIAIPYNFPPVSTNPTIIMGGRTVYSGSVIDCSPIEEAFISVSSTNATDRRVYISRQNSGGALVASKSDAYTTLGVDSKYSADGLSIYMAAGTADNSLSSQAVLYKLDSTSLTTITSFIVPSSYVNNGVKLAISPDGLTHAIVCSSSSSSVGAAGVIISIYNSSNNQLVKTISRTTDYSRYGMYITYSPDSTQLCILSGTGSTTDSFPRLAIYDTSTWAIIKTINQTNSSHYRGTSVKYSKDGSLLAVVSAASNVTNTGTLLMIYNTIDWTINNMVLIQELYPDFGLDLDFSTDGKFLAISGSSTTVNTTGKTYIQIYSLERRAIVAHIIPAQVCLSYHGTSVNYMPTEQYFIIGGNSTTNSSTAAPRAIRFSAIAKSIAYKSSNIVNDILISSSAGYALETGLSGETKKVNLLWY